MMRAATLLAWLPTALACSLHPRLRRVAFPWQAAEFHGISHRANMELGNILGRTSYSIEAIPATSVGGKYGSVALVNHLKVVGPVAMKVIFEGMNEKGLTVSAQSLTESVYEEGSAQGKNDVSALDLAAQLLSTCDSVEQSLKFVESVSVIAPAWLEALKLSKEGVLHWAITDPTGRSVVLEYLQGRRVVHDNGPRVMTNDPNLEWQWRNLNTYSNLNPSFPHQNDFLGVYTNDEVGVVPRAVGHGWNLFGMPGDTSPPSRFVRLFYLRGYALHASPLSGWEDELFWAPLSSTTPFGSVARDAAQAPVDQPEYTPYGILKIPGELKMLVRGYRNSQWRQIDLSKLDLTQAQSWPLEDGSLGIQDITGSGIQDLAV
eukprot:CAMPEP_0115068406 /NCGR_PEP_ID=MMETSP0227-20121206/11953_1 /TAXON_ID=89957 /ORGANISM="Polarella glacialis, Strain CCMP 1383" /LENGTH=374 /DNA_ID=CAMNT_0002454631 /DNA_START=41 /DNA_END=1167 /DNA_ORIENTATION=+